MIEFSGQLIAAVVGFVLSFLVENVPGFSDLWAAYRYKGLSIVAAGLAVVAAMVGLSYAGAPIAGIPRPFIWDGLWTALGAFISYMFATQTAYVLQAGSLRRKQKPQHDEDYESE